MVGSVADPSQPPFEISGNLFNIEVKKVVLFRVELRVFQVIQVKCEVRSVATG